ncbi:CIC11C00000003786 [Sungouiella intermedia]|uniref:CIC11C00000003786 n=1 Tax=Sungouiella intermedia TaxID=45354 RepID=A0A1L0BAG2_9ASCO|nr:CIC11C00000003786 [[Candida] intermedia]
MEQLRNDEQSLQPPDLAGGDTEVKAQHYKRMAEMRKTYEFWRNIANKKMAEDDKYLPFPSEDDPPVPGQVYKDFIETHLSDVYKGKDKQDKQDKQANGTPILNDLELGFLKARIAEFISFTGSSPYGPERKIRGRPRVEEKEGFSLYGTNDEEGLHDGNADDYDEDEQDDYDLDELEDAEKFLYDYGPHHIEVEVNNGPASSEPVDPDEPSCEFTFEYDRNGTLVPTDNNIEEKLRLMCLQSQGEETGQTGKKKKSNKKKKKKATVSSEGVDESCCLFCQYEAFFGVKPVHTMKWYDKKMQKEAKRRQKIREKLENAKLKALRRQREFSHGNEDAGDSQ